VASTCVSSVQWLFSALFPALSPAAAVPGTPLHQMALRVPGAEQVASSASSAVSIAALAQFVDVFHRTGAGR
jgi:hypothetical protein